MLGVGAVVDTVGVGSPVGAGVGTPVVYSPGAGDIVVLSVPFDAWVGACVTSTSGSNVVTASPPQHSVFIRNQPSMAAQLPPRTITVPVVGISPQFKSACAMKSK